MAGATLEANIRSLRGPILVTGAAEFLGANLFKKLCAVRDDVYAVVHRNRGWRLDDVPAERILEADLTDHVATNHLVDTVAPQIVFHCAGHRELSAADTDLSHQTEFGSVVNLVERLASRPFTAFVNAGSSAEYGSNSAAPQENSPCEPNSSDGITKLAIANFLRLRGKQHDFPAVNLRLYSVYGPLDDLSRPVPQLLRAASAGTPPPSPTVGLSHDLVHVDDVCEAFVLAAARMHPGLYGEHLNIGTGIPTSPEELTRQLLVRTGATESGAAAAQPSKSLQSSTAGEYADPGKAEREIGWRARTTLGDGLASTSRWVDSLTDRELAVAADGGSARRRRSLSAIIACYMDGEAIPVMHKRLTATFQQLDIDYEIIFVNDCSPDDSAEVIREISERDPRVIGIAHSRNFGSHMAFRSGMELSTKDGVVLFDGDLQDPPELITEFYAKWEQGNEVVYGIRVKREMPWYLGFWYKLYYRLLAGFSYLRIPLDAGEFSLLDRRVVGWLLSCPERELYLRGLRAYVGFKQAGVDYIRPERMFGRSTRNFRKNFDFAKRTIFSFSNSPLQLVTNTGIITLVLSTLYGLDAILMRLVFPGAAPAGFTTTLLFILLFGSLNLIAIGVVGEYVSMILTEVKGRPRLIREALIRNGTRIDLPPNGTAATALDSAG